MNELTDLDRVWAFVVMFSLQQSESYQHVVFASKTLSKWVQFFLVFYTV